MPEPRRARPMQRFHLQGLPTPAKQTRITSYTISTTAEQKDTFDHAVGKFFFANNIPFRCVESSLFHDLVKLLRSGYKLPSRKLLSTKILDNVNKELEEECKAKLSGKEVTIAIDGWSNLSNDPIVASSIQHGDKVYIVDSIDTSGEYLTSVSQDQIKVAEEKFGVQVTAIVTDNASNMTKMGKSVVEECSVIQYGCGAHHMNLLAKDLAPTTIVKRVREIAKNFSEHPSA